MLELVWSGTRWLFGLFVIMPMFVAGPFAVLYGFSLGHVLLLALGAAMTLVAWGYVMRRS